MDKGDFSSLAKDYADYRPGYNSQVIEHIIFSTGLAVNEICAVDVGAGTGIFSKCLAGLGVKRITAVEPNDEMRKMGELVNGDSINFLKGSAEKTNLSPNSFDLVSMASSFHWTDYTKALQEFNKLLRSTGIFTAIWNPRLTEKSDVENEVQTLLSEKYKVLNRVSSGRSGITEKLREIMVDSGYFRNIYYMDAVDVVFKTPEEYLGAWRSVNDIQAQLGHEKFTSFLEDVKNILINHKTVEVHYLTRAWVGQKD